MMSTSDYVLLHGDAFRGSVLDWNATTASANNSQDLTIEVSLSCPERPLVPTILFVNIPGIDFTEGPPRIVRTMEDLILLRVPLIELNEYDYFIYRPGGEKGPSLKLIPRTTTTFHDEDVGLLRCGEEHYIIAALLASRKAGVYDLHRFDSKTEKWSKDEVSLVESQVSFPYGKKYPMNSERLLFHLTSTVIPIGGEGGTMGWVDLWRGILLCDLLSKEPNLRGVPLPLPLEQMSQGIHLGCPKSIRGITTVFDKEPFLKFVHLGVNAVPVGDEGEWQMLDWTITTWSNKKMTTSWKDWHEDCKVEASGTSISSKLKSKMLKSGLLSPGGADPERAFKNILVSFPAPGIINDGVVYLQARVKFMDLKVFVLALDTGDNKLLGAVEFATKRVRGSSVVYFPSNIGKYVDPEARVMPIPEGGEDDSNWEELSQYEGTESLKFPPLVIRLTRHQDFPSLGDVSLNDAGVST